MKRARPHLAHRELHAAETLLTTADVARLLRVHPKHVYRLLRRGLPAHRVGGEWRFITEEVFRWSGAARAPSATPRPREADAPAVPAPAAGPLPLVAANGDLAVEYLLARLTASRRPLFGHVQADRGGGLELLKRNDVLAAGGHGDGLPATLGNERLAFVHLVTRDVVLALRRGLRLNALAQIQKWRVASRPATAGVRQRFDEELRRHGINPEGLHGHAVMLPSHREVVCAVARGDVDVGLASRAWADRVGLDSLPLYREPYGLLIKASLLGHPRVIQICETAQSAEFRREIGAVRGYEARQTGAISYEPPRSKQSAGALQSGTSAQEKPS